MADGVRERSREAVRQQRAGEVYGAVQELNKTLAAAANDGLRVELRDTTIDRVGALVPIVRVSVELWEEVVPEIAP